MKIPFVIVCALLAATGVTAQTKPDPNNVFTMTESIKGQKIRLSGDKGQYHSLHFFLTAARDNPDDVKLPHTIEFTLISVMKAKRLNSDLYVVFLADGKEFHFGSNRSAIKRPVPGRTWIGEQMVFKIPIEEYLKLAAAEKLAIKMGEVVFDFDEKAKAEVRSFAKPIKL